MCRLLQPNSMSLSFVASATPVLRLAQPSAAWLLFTWITPVRLYRAIRMMFLRWLNSALAYGLKYNSTHYLCCQDSQFLCFVIQQISSKQSTRVVPGYRSSQVATVLHQAEIRCIWFAIHPTLKRREHPCFQCGASRD